MAITTKGGDTGLSNIKDSRLPKTDIVFDVLGTIDELIAHLVICQTLTKKNEFKMLVDDLSLIAAIIAGHQTTFDQNRIKQLEEIIFTFHHINIFSYPYNDYNKSIINLTRTVARRLERVYWQYDQNHDLDHNIGIYLNRLSDYLFTFI